jgi:uncharacterized protein YlxW (UPF0749 family)
MSLLDDLMGNTLDAGYAERARSRAAGHVPRPTRPGRAVGVVLLVVLGLLTGTAVAQVRQRSQAQAGVKAALLSEVQRRSAESDRLSRDADALRADVAARRDAALATDAQGRDAAELVRNLEIATGGSAVTGPGVVLTVDDAPEPTAQDAQSRGGVLSDGRVLDRDLQGVVNGLWAAGAEAIAVNRVRLSPRTAIRSAGEAVLVDFRPLSPPYRVEAIGKPNALETGFVDSASGRRLQTLASVSGITWSIARADTLRLPAGTQPQLRAARPAEGPS